MDAVAKRELRVQRASHRAELEIEGIRATRELLLALLSNPAVQIVGAFSLLEYLERRALIGNIAATSAEAGVLTASLAEALAPTLPSLGEGILTLLKSLSGLIPTVRV